MAMSGLKPGLPDSQARVVSTARENPEVTFLNVCVSDILMSLQVKSLLPFPRRNCPRVSLPKVF